MNPPRATKADVSRRTILRSGIVAGSLAIGGALAAGSASSKQGGVAYLKDRHRTGQNNSVEMFKIVEHCETKKVPLDCDGVGDGRYAKYKIRCPNYTGGEDGEDGEDHGGSCPGGGCGRHVLVNPNRRLQPGLDQLYEFATYRVCGTGPGGDTYVKGAIKPVRGEST